MKLSKRHAYLIIAHSNPYVLKNLISLLDDERNDIYIHVDKKTKDFDFEYFQHLPQKSKLIFIERQNVYWGHISQIKVELNLFRAAFQQSVYSYYHLISGADLPIKPQDEIHAFFQQHEGSEFMGFSNDKLDLEKVNKIHLCSKYQRLEERELFKRIGRKISKLFLSLQRSVGYRATSATYQHFVHGANWVSITHHLVSALLEHEKQLLKFYRRSSCADEIYKQTFVYNSRFKECIFDLNDELSGSQRLMDWGRGRPYTFREEDYELIMSSDLMFARKFEDAIDKAIVDEIYKTISTKQ